MHHVFMFTRVTHTQAGTTATFFETLLKAVLLLPLKGVKAHVYTQGAHHVQRRALGC